MQALTIWLNKEVKAASFLPFLLLPFFTAAQGDQNLTLQEAFSLAEKNYPLIQQKGLLKQSEQLIIENLGTYFLPQVAFNGQATYQSDVTKIDIPIPGVKIPTQSKDQYKAIAEVNQLLFDGGVTKSSKDIQLLSTSVEESKIAVELYNLKNRINQLYFGILLQDELLKQTNLLLKDIQACIDKVKPQVDNGVMLRSNLQLLQVQLLQIQQRAIEIKATRKGLTDALALFVNRPVTDATKFIVPAMDNIMDTIITRPELQLYQNQSRLLEGQQKLITANNLPKATAFVQGGYGKPGLNLLSNEFKFFYISGVRLNWSLGGLYTAKRNKKLMDINRQSVDVQKEIFLLNTQTTLKQQKAEIDKYAALVTSDKEIIQLRHQITDAAKAQLENAVITANDYLIQVNAEDAARQSLILHQLQWQQAQMNYVITSGKI